MAKLWNLQVNEQLPKKLGLFPCSVSWEEDYVQELGPSKIHYSFTHECSKNTKIKANAKFSYIANYHKMNFIILSLSQKLWYSMNIAVACG
jgi:hypothetical protein